MRKLLKESDIRQMMKLANIPTLSDKFIEKLNETSIYDEDQSIYEQDEEEEVPPADEPGGEEEMDIDLPDDAEDAGDAPEMGGAEAGQLEGVETVVKAIKMGLEEMGMNQVADKIQVELSDEEGAEGAPEDMEMSPEAPEEGEGLDMEAPPEGDDEMGMPPMEEADDMTPPEDELDEAGYQMEDDDLVNEVVRRVARRLMKSK